MGNLGVCRGVYWFSASSSARGTRHTRYTYEAIIEGEGYGRGWRIQAQTILAYGALRWRSYSTRYVCVRCNLFHDGIRPILDPWDCVLGSP